MKHKAKDTGLRKALAAKRGAPPSNFTFSTMQKIDGYVHRREKRREQYMFCSAVAVSMLLLACIVFIIHHYYIDVPSMMFLSIADTFMQLDIQASPYCHFGIILLVLMLFDHWMRRRYFKRHNNQ